MDISKNFEKFYLLKITVELLNLCGLIRYGKGLVSRARISEQEIRQDLFLNRVAP